MPKLKWVHDECYYNLACRFPINTRLLPDKHPDNPDNIKGVKFHGKNNQDLRHLRDLVEDEIEETEMNPFDYTLGSISKRIQNKQWLTVVLQVSMWGGMVKEKVDNSFALIYHPPTVKIEENRKSKIIDAVKKAYCGLLTGESLETVFNYFKRLKWSNTMTSKVLHFLSLAALDEGSDVPVPIDDSMVQKKLWEAYYEVLKKNKSLNKEEKRLIKKTLNTSKFCYDTYDMYLSSMKAWADNSQCSLKNLEESLFAYHKSPKDPSESKKKTNGKEEFMKLFNPDNS